MKRLARLPGSAWPGPVGSSLRAVSALRRSIRLVVANLVLAREPLDGLASGPPVMDPALLGLCGADLAVLNDERSVRAAWAG